MTTSWATRFPAVVVTLSVTAWGCADDGAVSEQRLEAVAQPEVTTPDEGDLPGGDDAVPESGSTVEITVVGVAGYAGGDLAGVVMREADGLVVGGFATTIEDGSFTTTQTLRRPAEAAGPTGPWPGLTDDEAILTPGEYVLTLWVDTGLGGYTRWFPVNTDAHGLAGCVQRFQIEDAARTEITVGGDVRSTGYVGICEPDTAVHDAGVLPTRVEIVQPDRQPATPPFADLFAGDTGGMVHELIVWRDDFLAIGEAYQPRPLPEDLPPAIAEQFPPEIQDLFPDGLPPTLAEAMEIIEDAGMMTAVEDAVSSIPGAYDAIFALEPPPSTWLFARSADGLEWELLDVELPDGVTVILDAAASSDGLVVVGHRALGGSLFASEVVVAWTHDLESWTSARLAPERPADLPGGATLDIWGASVEANSGGWVVTALAAVDLGEADPPTMPSPELAPYLVPGGWGPSPIASRWYASWDGEPVPTDPLGAPTTEPGMIVATNTGFVHLSDLARYTSDGTTWEARAMLAPAVVVRPWVTFVQALPDGFVVSFEELDADPAVYRVDDSAGSWTPLEVPGLPSALGPAQVADGNGYVLEVNDWSGTVQLWIVATPDGDRWFLEQYFGSDVGAGTPGYEPRVAAVHDGTLLMGASFPDEGGWWSLTF